MSNKTDESYIKDYIIDCRREAKEAKHNRMRLNRDNYDMYHLKHDFSHKQAGQSTEVLSKIRMAVEQTKSFFQQALTDTGDWWKCEAKDGTDGEGMAIKPYEVTKITNHMLKQAKYYSHIGNSIQQALLGSLCIGKPYGVTLPKPKYKVRKQGRGKSYRKFLEMTEDKTWELRFASVRQENWYPDPTGSGLYEIEENFIDLHEVKRMSEGEEPTYDKAAVSELQAWNGGDIEDQRKSSETGQSQLPATYRPRVKITEFWGDIVDRDTGDMLYENCVVTLANDTTIIRKPTENPLWHQKHPYVAAALVEVANSVWGVALMDAGTAHNRLMIEFFNLIVDSAMKQVHGVNQLRTGSVRNPEKLSDGIPWGTTIEVDETLPPGAKVMEAVITGEVPQQALPVLNLIQQEYNAAVLTSDLRAGVTPFREQKATAVVEQSNTITSVFQGVAKNFEQNYIQPELELAWQTTAQNWDLIDEDTFITLFGKERGTILAQMDPQDVFAATVQGVKFSVYGISMTLSKAGDFRKIMQLLQTIGTSEPLIESFLQEGYTFGKLLGEAMYALDIDKEKLRGDTGGGAPQAQQQGPPQEDPLAQAGGAPGAQPDTNSQAPQAGAGSLSDLFSRPQFPGSPATRGQ